MTGTSRCLPCFCFGVTTACRATARHRHRLHLRFDRPDDFKGKSPGQGDRAQGGGVTHRAEPLPTGVNVTVPSTPSLPALSATQLHVDVATEEFQLLDLSRRFLALDAFWALPAPFLGDKVTVGQQQGWGHPGTAADTALPLPGGRLRWGAELQRALPAGPGAPRASPPPRRAAAGPGPPAPGTRWGHPARHPQPAPHPLHRGGCTGDGH